VGSSGCGAGAVAVRVLSKVDKQRLGAWLGAVRVQWWGARFRCCAVVGAKLTSKARELSKQTKQGKGLVLVLI